MIRRSKDASRAVQSHIEIPCPEGLAYRPFQKAAVEYTLTHKDTLIGDAPGAGKTIMAMGGVNANDSARKILIISPGFLKPHWKQKFEEWDVKGLSVGIAQGLKGEFPTTNAVIINYELLKAYRSQLRTTDWDCLIVDEIHKLKSGKADRTKEVFGGIKRNSNKKIIDRVSPITAKQRIFLTGTPSLNGKPKELWPIIKSIDPDGLGKDWFAFAKRYCKLEEITRFNPAKGKEEHVGWIWNGEDNVEELQRIMRERFLIRRLKSEIMPELPAKTRLAVPLAASGKIKKLLAEELLAYDEYVKGREDVLIDIPPFGEFSQKMHEVGLAMVKPTVEVAESDLESMDKLIIVCYHNDVAEQIFEHFKNEAVLINGNVPVMKRQPLVDKFQNDPTIRVAVGTIGSMGEGFTMTAAYQMLIIERTWVPGTMTQVEDRIHRHGMQDKAIYKHLVLEDSLAERQIKILLDKQEKSDRMLDKEAR